jgi:hypothetical protein
MIRMSILRTIICIGNGHPTCSTRSQKGTSHTRQSTRGLLWLLLPMDFLTHVNWQDWSVKARSKLCACTVHVLFVYASHLL